MREARLGCIGVRNLRLVGLPCGGCSSGLESAGLRRGCAIRLASFGSCRPVGLAGFGSGGAPRLTGSRVGGTLRPGRSGDLGAVGPGQRRNRLAMGAPADEVDRLGYRRYLGAMSVGVRRSEGGRGRGSDHRDRQESRWEDALHELPQMRLRGYHEKRMMSLSVTS